MSTSIGGWKDRQLSLFVAHTGAVISVFLTLRWALGLDVKSGYLGGLVWDDKVCLSLLSQYLYNIHFGTSDYTVPHWTGSDFQLAPSAYGGGDGGRNDGGRACISHTGHQRRRRQKDRCQGRAYALANIRPPIHGVSHLSHLLTWCLFDVS